MCGIASRLEAIAGSRWEAIAAPKILGSSLRDSVQFTQLGRGTFSNGVSEMFFRFGVSQMGRTAPFGDEVELRVWGIE